MGMVKYSIIGLMIMLPFLMQTTIQNTQYKYKERQRVWIEQAIEEASYDAGYAMKTYSEYAYDSREIYNIKIAYDEVIRTFFDSLKFRNFKYSLEDFPVIVFVEYDGIVLYNPVNDALSQKIYYSQNHENYCLYYSLSDEVRVLTYETAEYKVKSISKEERNVHIIQTIESALNDYYAHYYAKSGKRFSLPEFEGESAEYLLDDVGIIICYDPKQYAYINELESYKIIPSGIMKMDLPIDL